MACYKPITGYRSRLGRNENGKWPIVFNMSEGYKDIPVTVPCGQCIGCRLEKSRQWAIRCMHEAKLHDDNCFITLTYNDENLPEGGTLVKKHFVDFMKRLRSRFSGQKIMYYHCGEYGENFARPHHHACLFGVDFRDKLKFKKNAGNWIYTSELLDDIWQYGYCSVADVTFESAAYVARYCTKKVTGDDALTHYAGREPEYATMSLKPAVGKNYALRYADEIMYNDSIVLRGGLQLRPARYYDKLFEEYDYDKYMMNKSKRRKMAKEMSSDNTYDRLSVKERIKKLNIMKRSYESEI